MTHGEFLTPKEIAALMRVDQDTLYNWLKDPGIPDGIIIRPRPRGRMIICVEKFSQWNAGRK